MKFIKFLCILLGAIIVAAGGYYAFKLFFWDKVYQKVDRAPIVSSQPTNNGNSKVLNYSPHTDSPFTILLLGVDSTNFIGRSDTIMLATIDPNKKKVYLLSVPRDTKMEIAGKNKEDKVNSAFNYGVGTTISTLQNYFAIPIDYYATINFQGFMNMVDVLGGINVNVSENMTFYDRIKNQEFSLQAGEQKLSSYQALNYSRFRYDSQGDFGRNKRQQQVLTAIISQSADFRNVTKITQMMNVIGDNVRTDLTLKDIANIAYNLKNISSTDILTIPMKAYPTNENGISYVGIDNNEVQRIHNDINTLLNGNDLSSSEIASIQP